MRLHLEHVLYIKNVFLKKQDILDEKQNFCGDKKTRWVGEVVILALKYVVFDIGNLHFDFFAVLNLVAHI